MAGFRVEGLGFSDYDDKHYLVTYFRVYCNSASVHSIFVRRTQRFQAERPLRVHAPVESKRILARN